MSDDDSPPLQAVSPNGEGDLSNKAEDAEDTREKGKGKRSRKDVPESEILRVLTIWRNNRENWGPTEASRQLDYPRGTLSGWRDKYSDPTLTKVPVPPRPKGRMRAAGGGRKRKVLDYEDSVLEYYEECLRQDGKVTNRDILSYCRTKPAFILKSTGAQEVWVSRFIASTKRLFVNPVPQEDAPEVIELTDSTLSDATALTGSGTPEPPVDIEPTDNQNRSSGREGSSEADADTGGMDSDEVVTESVPLIPAPKRYSLRDRSKSAKILFRYTNDEDSRLSARITVGIYPEDCFSVEPCQPLTSPVIDYVIYKQLARGKGSVYPFGSSLFSQIEHVDQIQKSFSAVKHLVDKVEWNLYPFVLIPVSGRNHWSLLVVENPISDRVTCFHVDSIAGKHQSKYVYDTAKLFFEEIIGHSIHVDGHAVTMEPQQRNTYDCGVYMLYAMNRIAQYVVENSPQTLTREIRALTSKCTASKADKFRSSLHAQFEKLC